MIAKSDLSLLFSSKWYDSRKLYITKKSFTSRLRVTTMFLMLFRSPSFLKPRLF